ncbi:hypothetical protein C0J52_06331 [Blattella germanica]|nr:hypothetical protein C0J52_06331 [Blattella germanica]
MEVTKVEQRSYIKIAFLRGCNARECHAELQQALGNRALPYRTDAKQFVQMMPNRLFDNKTMISKCYVWPFSFPEIPASIPHVMIPLKS